MGYDMTWNHIPDDLVERKRKLEKSYDFASEEFKDLKERNKAHYAERVRSLSDEDRVGAFLNKSLNLPEWNEWWDKREQEDRDIGTSFRLNMGGMARYATVMNLIGMLNDSSHPPFPRFQDYGFEDWDAFEATAPDDPQRVHYDEDHYKTIGDYVEGEGIAAYKFGSNDGWHVRSEEIISALVFYDEWVTENPGVSGPFKDSDSNEYWQLWIRFLRRSAELGDGFRVY